MLDTSQRWNLFGYDLSRTLHYIRSGWREFLWGDESPVSPLLDEVVLAHLESGEQRYMRAGREVAAPIDGAPLAEAVVLPERLVLARSLRLPLAAEPELDAVMRLETGSSSPFPPEDTCAGWVIQGRDDTGLELQLAISSRSAVMAHISEQMGSRELDDYEVWATTPPRLVLLEGFGEDRRRERNTTRLRRMAGIALLCLSLIVAIAAVAAGASYLELQRVQQAQAEVQQSSREAVALREQLAAARSMLDTGAALLQEYPPPHRELQRLSQLLGDGTWLSSIRMDGLQLRLEGESADAPGVMQQLLNHPAYSSVEAPVAFRKMRSGSDRFVFDLALAPERVAP